MANTYADTVLLEARLWQDDNVGKKFERRREMSKVTPVFLDGQKYVADVEKIKQAETQATSIMYLKQKDYTPITAKTCSPDGETGGSGKQSITWAKRGFEVKHELKKYAGNELKAMEAFAYNLYEGEASFWLQATGMEAIQIAYLEANRSQINGISAGNQSRNTWNGAADYFVEVANANRNRFYDYVQSDMILNNYSDVLWDVHNSWWRSDINYYSNQASANNVNTQFQFSPNSVGSFELAPSNLISPATYYDSLHYIIPQGGVVMLTWNEMLNREGAVSGDRQWTIAESKFYPGIFFDVFIKSGCSDTTANGGGTQDKVIDFEYILNYSLSKQPTVTAGDNPIYKYQILST